VGRVRLTFAERIGINPGSTTPKDEEFLAPAPCQRNCSCVRYGRFRCVCWFAMLPSASYFDDVKTKELHTVGGVCCFGW
jgi:hypothetical protein